MQLRVKKLNLSSGGPLIAVVNQDDARKLDIYALDRVNIRNRHEIIAAVNIDSGKTVNAGEIGLFDEVVESLRVKSNEIVTAKAAKRPLSIAYIKKKLDGKHLNEGEIKEIVNDIVANNLSQIELTYFVAGCYCHGLDLDETAILTKAMGESGSRLRLGKKIIVDKHCIGGVANNRTSMIIVPIIAAAGLTIPKTSTRAITSAAGTADTMEVLAKVSLPLKKIESIVRKTNGCIIWGGTLDLASADDKLIKVEYPLSLDPRGILLASVLSKNVAVGTTHMLIDIPIGKGAKVESKKDAVRLKRAFMSLGNILGIKVKCIITDGSQPIGNGIGPALEARDVMFILKRDGRRPMDLERKSVMMANIMLKMVRCKKDALDILDSGLAYKKMIEIIKMQGKNDGVELAKYNHEVRSNKNGIVKEVNNKKIASIARIAGAPKDMKAGVYLEVHKGDRVRKGDILYTIYSESVKNLGDAIEASNKIDAIKID